MKRRALGFFALAVLSVADGAASGAVSGAVSAAAAGGDLDTVMSLLAQRRHGRVEFVEQKFLAILDHPVESSGELLYDAPDRLEKRTLMPRAGDPGACRRRADRRSAAATHAWWIYIATRRFSRSSKASAPPSPAIEPPSSASFTSNYRRRAALGSDSDAAGPPIVSAP